MTTDDDKTRVGIVLEVDDSPLTLYVWAHLLAATMVDELHDHGILASVVQIEVDGLIP